LVDGELPSYKWLYNDKDQKREDFLKERFALLKVFLTEVIEHSGSLDILNLQEVGCEEDVQLV
jgi:hypothetical protein